MIRWLRNKPPYELSINVGFYLCCRFSHCILVDPDDVSVYYVMHCFELYNVWVSAREYAWAWMSISQSNKTTTKQNQLFFVMQLYCACYNINNIQHAVVV